MKNFFIVIFSEWDLLALNVVYGEMFMKGRVLGVDLEEPNCAQIVLVKARYFQTVPNETKNTLKNWNRINCL